MYVLEKGEYCNKEAMGLTSPDTAVRSIQRIGHVSTVDSPQMAKRAGHDDHSLFPSGLGAFSALLRPLQQGGLQRSQSHPHKWSREPATDGLGHTRLFLCGGGRNVRPLQG